MIQRRSTIQILLMSSVAFIAVGPASAQYAAGGGTAAGGNAVAIGPGASATDLIGVAIGQSATSNGTGSVAIGGNSAATTSGAIAVGNGASATGNSAEAVGSGASADGDQGAAFGPGATATGDDSTAIGAGAGSSGTAGNSYNSAVGAVAGQKVNGAFNSGFGVSSGQAVTGSYNSGFGAGAGVGVTGNANYAGGYVSGQQVTGDANVGIGAAAGNYVTGNGNVALGLRAGSGTSATPLTIYSTVAIGSDSQVSANYGVAIGTGSHASYADSVAIGSDSVTGAAAPTAVGYLTGATAPASEVSVGDSTSGITRRITNVADGSAATDAVTVAQLGVVNTKADTLGSGTAQALGGGATYDSATGALTTPVYSIGGTNVSGIGAAFTAVDTISGNQGTSLAGLLGGGTVYNSATGTLSGGSFQAGSGGASYASVAQALAAIPTGGGSDTSAVHYDDASHTSVTLNPGGSAAGLHNVAAGDVTAASTDAVNGAQLYATNSQVTTNTGDIASLSSGIANGTIGLVQQTGGAPGTGAITIGAATGGTSVSIAGTDGDRVLSGVAAGVALTDAVNVGQLTTAVSGATANAVQYDDASHTSVTLNAGGSAAALHNVAAGTVSATSGDAVNGAQLYATNSQVATNTGDIAVNSAAIANQTVQITALDNGTAGAFRANNTGGYAAPVAGGSNAVAGGFGAVATGTNATALGANATATGTNSVALGYASDDDGRANVVSVGAGGAERQVTNVAAGTRTTDAVNVGQLNTGLGNALGSANAYTDARIAAVNYDIRKVRRDADSGTAAAMAMAMTPQAYGPGKGMIAGGMGVYRDQTAFAFTASKAFIDGHTMVKAGGTVDTRGVAGGAVGLGYQF